MASAPDGDEVLSGRAAIRRLEIISTRRSAFTYASPLASALRGVLGYAPAPLRASLDLPGLAHQANLHGELPSSSVRAPDRPGVQRGGMAAGRSTCSYQQGGPPVAGDLSASGGGPALGHGNFPQVSSAPDDECRVTPDDAPPAMSSAGGAAAETAHHGIWADLPPTGAPGAQGAGAAAHLTSPQRSPHAPRAAPTCRQPLFNPPAVETVDPTCALPFADDMERYVIGTIVSPYDFLNRVLFGVWPDAPTPPPPPSRMNAQWVHELRRTRYLRPIRPGPALTVRCPLFAVLRSDGRLRLIFDGRVVNRLCKEPPKCRLTSIHADLERLLADEVQEIVTCDFTSWFVQIACHPDISDRMFGAALRDGQDILTGVPMGWAWAPVIAQAIASSFSRAVCARLPFAPAAALTYIDNLAFGLRERGQAPTVRRAIEAVARDWGVVIKASSWESGRSVTWRGLVVDLDRRTFTFVEKFSLKMVDAVRTAQAADWRITVEDTMVLVGCMLYVTYVTRASMARLHATLCFLSRLAVAVDAGRHTGSAVLRWPRAAADEAVAVPVTMPHSLPPPPTSQDAEVFGVSDAAGPSEDGAELRCRAFAYHTAERMVVEVNPISSDDIFREELRAMVDGLCDAVNADEQEIMDLLNPRPATQPSYDGGANRVTWLCDNLRALFVLARGWTTLWDANSIIQQHWKWIRFAFAEQVFAYVPSRSNIMDAFTRGARPGRRVAPPCPLHPGAQCPEFLEFVDQARVAMCPPPEARGPRARRAVVWRVTNESITFQPDMPTATLQHLI